MTAENINDERRAVFGASLSLLAGAASGSLIPGKAFAKQPAMASSSSSKVVLNGNLGAPMKLIGIEEHFLTAEILKAWSDAGLEATDPSVAFHSGVMEGRLLNLAEDRIALMDETGLDIQVLSLTTPALHDLGAESVDLARRTNDALAAAVARHPTRFQAMATLPMAVPEAAARELERCIKTLGFKGTLLCGKVGKRHLDDLAFAPVFHTAAELGVPVFLHPRVPDPAVREAYYSGFSPDVDAAFATYGLGWHYDAGIQFIRLVLSGTFDRLPNLQVILGHWGELVLFYAERLAAMDRVSGLAHPIATYLRKNLYVTASGMFLPHFLERAAVVVGADRLLFSTDFPYQYRPGHEARSFLDNCGLSVQDKAGFAHGNWIRLIGDK
ncbi:amidohydrolase family protein [Stenotrophomonas indicatrix]